MTSRNRETLRNYFGDGKLPTRYHFADLIDSMLNMSDEGFSKSPQNGIELSAPVTQDALISFYREQRHKTVLWSMGYGGGHDLLHFQPGSVIERKSQTPVLALDREARVGVNIANPRHTLDVAGVVASEGRRGTYELGRKDGLLADGEWKDITETLHGCQAFEVMAGVGSPGKGRYALMHAIALNTYNPTAGWLEFFSRKKRIRTHDAWYGRRCDRLQLCWEGSSGDNAAYKLRIRTGCNYGKDERGKDVLIKVLMTRLWFDETTQEPGP
jgi:hypothetical protein